MTKHKQLRNHRGIINKAKEYYELQELVTEAEHLKWKWFNITKLVEKIKAETEILINNK